MVTTVSQGLQTLLHGKTFFSVVRLGSLCLCMDPSVGCGQKKNNFWIRIEQKFNLLYDLTSRMRKKMELKQLVVGMLLNLTINSIRSSRLILLFSITTSYRSTLNVLLVFPGFSTEAFLVRGTLWSKEESPTSLNIVLRLHKVPKYNPLILNWQEVVLSSDDEAGGADSRNRVNGVMGGTLERPQGRKAAKANAAARRRSKKSDEDEA